MTILLKTATMFLLATSLAGTPPAHQSSKEKSLPVEATEPVPKIQAAILLDVSNSMDGLIGQAKAQLWNMVSVMGKAKCNNNTPQIEIALYEYGSPRNDVSKGYAKQITAFTTDLDGLSKNLFSLTTNGGNEYCGQVIYTAVNELAWDTSSQHYKVIFIAGNEDFLQGSLQYTQACEAAKKKGIVVNTIYCGDKMQGIREHWNLGGECGGGSFTNINQNARIEDIPTPYDSTLIVLNKKLNSTYLGYGSQGWEGIAKQESVDRLNMEANNTAALKRITVKGNKNLYKNSTWDLVDASIADSTFLTKVKAKELPDSLQKMSKVQLQELVKNKKAERGRIQEQITTVAAKRDVYLAEERKRKATANQQTLETETEKLIKEQARRFKMMIE